MVISSPRPGGGAGPDHKPGGRFRLRNAPKTGRLLDRIGSWAAVGLVVAIVVKKIFFKSADDQLLVLMTAYTALTFWVTGKACRYLLARDDN